MIIEDWYMIALALSLIGFNWPRIRKFIKNFTWYEKGSMNHVQARRHVISGKVQVNTEKPIGYSGGTHWVWKNVKKKRRKYFEPLPK